MRKIVALAGLALIGFGFAGCGTAETIPRILRVKGFVGNAEDLGGVGAVIVGTSPYSSGNYFIPSRELKCPEDMKKTRIGDLLIKGEAGSWIRLSPGEEDRLRTTPRQW